MNVARSTACSMSAAPSASPGSGGRGGGRCGIISTCWMGEAAGTGSSASHKRGGGSCTGFSSDMPETPDPKIHPATPAAPPPVRGASRWGYAELDVTTNFSFLRGASHPDELVYRAAELGHAAIGITDLNSLAGIVRSHQAAKNAGIKFCVGTRLAFTDAPDVLVWVENRKGYASLCQLLTLGKRRAEKGACTLNLEDLLGSPQGLLAAIAPQRIDPQAGDVDPDAIKTVAGKLKDAFGRN